MYLGLDLGTSGLRALLVGEDGAPVGVSDQAYPVAHPHPGWSEQRPEDWIVACRAALAELKRLYPVQLAALKGIGLSGQMHGATLLDKDDQVLRPCMLWNDTRAAEQAAQLDLMPGVRSLSGNIVFPGFTAPKLMWARAHEPALFDRVAKVLLPKDFLRLWLTGEHLTDMSDAAGTSWLDVGARAWSDPLLAASGMRRDQMPGLVEGTAPAGDLRADLRADWGIKGPVTIVGGGGDNAAAACGVGCFDEGDGFVSLGTSGVLLAAKSRFVPKPDSAVHSFCHAIPNSWYQMGVMLAATDCLNWLAHQTGTDPAELAGHMPEGLDRPGSIRFLPYLSGERTPHNDADIRGAFLGLGMETDHKDLTRAVMEGVAFALRDNLEALNATGTSLTRMLAIGGGSNSAYWLELIATVLGLPLDLPEAGDFGAALGAARLAMVGVGGAAAIDVMVRPPIANRIDPNPGLRDAYEDAYAQFRTLYPAIKAIS